MMLIRAARADDADTVCNVLRRSIAEQCAADHRNDPAILDRWLANKTPATIATWIGNPDAVILVAEEGGAILGVGGLNRPARSRSITSRRMRASAVSARRCSRHSKWEPKRAD
jgi:hypothetical protein